MCTCIVCTVESLMPLTCVLFQLATNTFKTYLCKKDCQKYLALQAGVLVQAIGTVSTVKLQLQFINHESQKDAVKWLSLLTRGSPAQ